jgi:hypothetical protein
MALDIGGGAGGAIGLQDVLRGLFERANANHVRQQEQQRINIEQQRANDEKAYRTLAAQSAADARTQAAKAQTQIRGLRIAGATKPGSIVQPETAQTLREADLGDLLEHQGATLPSSAMQGVAQASTKAPAVAPMRTTQNAGHGEQDLYTGTAAQLQGEEDRKTRADQIAQARQDKIDAASQATADKAEQAKLIASLRPAPQAPLVMVQTVDAQGNPVTKFVKKEADASYLKPANATTANRVASAEAVNKVGNDIMAKLSDPKYAAVVGPALGRASSLQDFIGNPPPEFAELAGEIESYALANMGVHGMRSAHGAEQIKALLSGRHTPASLIASIRGLQNFSNTFVDGNKPKAGGGSATPTTAATPAKRIRYDMNGNPIKD